MVEESVGVSFSLTEHKLIPKHEVLGEREVGELFGRYNINEKKLPRILQTDPIVKDLGAKVGDIIRISRDSGTAGSALYYRVVVKGR